MLLMKFLKTLNKNLKQASLLLILISFCQPAFSKTKVAVVDLVKIYQQYSLVEEANRLIAEGEEGLKRVIATAEGEMKKLETVTDAASEKRKDEIQAAVDDKVEDVQDLKENYNMKINRNIQDTITKLAQQSSYLAVMDKSFSVFAADDITTQLLAELEKIK